MTQPQPFHGLTMPVFAAFGWAGEEQATKFALSQLEAFVTRVHGDLSHDLRAIFPYSGIDRGGGVVYLAADKDDVESDLHILYYARPMSFQIALGISEKAKLLDVFRRLEESAGHFYQALIRLEPTWELHVRQMELTDDEESPRVFYQDIFKGTLSDLSLEDCEALVERAAYLNGEAQWVTPFSLSFRMPSEQVATMGTAVVRWVNDRLNALLPVIRAITGQGTRSPAARPKPAKAGLVESAPIVSDEAEAVGESRIADFIFVADLQPLHIRRGFINLTAGHWPFFAKNARTEIRDDVTLRFGDKLDTRSSVWRLMPSEQARIVLSDAGQRWLERNFDAGGRVEIAAYKNDEAEILITLAPADPIEEAA